MAEYRTGVDPERLRAAIQTQKEILREEQECVRELEERAAVARQIIDECEAKVRLSGERQSHLSQSINLLTDLLTLAAEAIAAKQPALALVKPEEYQRQRPVARLGRQHYLILSALREAPGAVENQLEQASGANSRWTKMALTEDIARGYVMVRNAGYELTPTGLDVLTRFERYRRAQGKPLPSLSEPSVSEADGDDDLDDKEEAA